MIPVIPWWRKLFTRQGHIQNKYYKLQEQLSKESPGSKSWWAIFYEMDKIRMKVNGDWL